jgi:hypothetical protein
MAMQELGWLRINLERCGQGYDINIMSGLNEAIALS